MSGKKGLIIGVANEHSIAWGCAKAISHYGAKLALTYQKDKTKEHVEPLLKEVPVEIFRQLDITVPEHFSSLVEEIKYKWSKLDFLIHSIAFAPKEDLQGRVIDSSREGFLLATEISCYSLIRAMKAFESLMKDGGSILTMTYYGSQKVVPEYGIMGPIKAMLESVVKYTAVELGKSKIRINAISSGPILTRAASGIAGFDKLLDRCKKTSPLNSNLTINDVGNLSAFLVSDLSENITGTVQYLDCGYSVMG
ncbi:MAG: enoyl-ACP reductase FabI [Rickettsiales bacterium]|nr:enoyl-ACP reductase FabI [Rickettsiales bacterium]